MRPLGAVPPPLFLIAGMATTQVGASIAKGLFDDLGPAGTVMLRVGFAAIALMLLWRPRQRGHSRADLALLVAFGLSLAFMNFAFYEAIARIPLGIAVTIEFIGPLGVAVAGSRRALDVLWVVLAGAGVVLLAEGGGFAAAGVALAGLAGVFWALYILASARVGQRYPGGGGLAIAMVFGTLALLPFGIAGAGADLLDPRLLAIGAAVALLASVIPYSLELEALRRLPTRVFGILMSLEPAVAALVGFVVLGEGLKLRSVLAIALVGVASAGASLGTASPPPRDA
ncbi:MAG: inner rane transporter RhtA [Thermoleophilaceae bacterium]|nr:inner rane transporter RhtA [Thermoleophilaceae bacterium]